MSRKTFRTIPSSRLPLVDANGIMTPAWYKFFTLLNNEIGGDGRDLVGGLVDGTTAVSGLTITGRGSLTDELDAVNANANQTAGATSGGGALTAEKTPSTATATSTDPNAIVTTNPISMTAMGGTGGPYTFNTVFSSGDNTINVVNGTTDTPTFSGTTGFNSKSAVFQTTIGDGVETYVLTHSVSLIFENFQ